jgi:hypothetical protein
MLMNMPVDETPVEPVEVAKRPLSQRFLDVGFLSVLLVATLVWLYFLGEVAIALVASY